MKTLPPVLTAPKTGTANCPSTSNMAHTGHRNKDLTPHSRQLSSTLTLPAPRMDLGPDAWSTPAPTRPSAPRLTITPTADMPPLEGTYRQLPAKQKLLWTSAHAPRPGQQQFLNHTDISMAPEPDSPLLGTKCSLFDQLHSLTVRMTCHSRQSFPHLTLLPLRSHTYFKAWHPTRMSLNFPALSPHRRGPTFHTLCSGHSGTLGLPMMPILLTDPPPNLRLALHFYLQLHLHPELLSPTPKEVGYEPFPESSHHNSPSAANEALMPPPQNVDDFKQFQELFKRVAISQNIPLDQWFLTWGARTL